MLPDKPNAAFEVEDARQRSGKNLAEQYLCFELAGQRYGLDQQSVIEVRDWAPAVPVPDMPSFIKGVLIEQDLVLPLIDLRYLFRLAARDVDSNSKIIFVKARYKDRDTVMGFQVDRVAGVLTPGIEEIGQAPDLNKDRRSKFVTGTYVIGSETILLINIHDLLTHKGLH